MVELLKVIWALCCRHHQNNDETYAVVTSLKNLLYFDQKPDVTNDEYLKKFKAQVESAEDFDTCVLGKIPCLIKKKLEKMFSKTMNCKSETGCIMQRDG